MNEPKLILDDLHYWRGDKKILNGVNWTVRQGEQWAVLGRNGSGKTTLMMIATGYVPSSLGRVFLVEGWQGELALQETRKKVGLVSSTLSDHLVRWRDTTTGLEIVLSGLDAMLGPYRRFDRTRAEEGRALLKRLGGEHLADCIFKTMSSGERQTCLIARCYTAQSELIILDEPCAGLDFVNRERLLSTIDSGCREHPNIPQVLITHHPEEIVSGITHVLMIREGSVVAQGPKEETLNEENLTKTYGVPLKAVHRDGRVWILPS
ncbi:MAG: ATP-binding cassette domain-containing protein [Candidatus Omnitrophica bacterium]|nr:ATP-binding cassette domain-containing protein [Candidatus Omnitrophota bacterium]